MNQIDLYFPIEKHGRKVAEYLVSVRPKDDMALDGIVHASEVYFEDANEDRHPMPHDEAVELLETIRRDMPDVWREIEEAVAAETLEECIEEREPVYAA